MTSLSHSPIAAHIRAAHDPAVLAHARREIVARYRGLKAAYRGGLKAEVDSLEIHTNETRLAVRQTRLRGRGRPIDLEAILAERCVAEGPQGYRRPRWALVDPYWRIAEGNGGVASDGNEITYDVGPSVVKIAATGYFPAIVPVGMPALPARVRELAQDALIREHAEWVGVLYEPASWRAGNDPALVVEWKDLIGEYYVLAVWDSAEAEYYL